MNETVSYSVEVALAFGGSLVMLAAVIAASVISARRVKAALESAERRARDG